MKLAAIIIATQAAWFATAYGAANNAPAIGITACLLALAVSTFLSDTRRAVFQLAIVLGLYGFAAETLMAATGSIRYGAPSPFTGVAPLWIVALWMAFAGMIKPAFGWLINRPAATALLGATMAPLSYVAASKLGALQFTEPLYVPILLLSLIWAIALPGAVYLAERLARKSVA